jgi:hypothetical protein
MNNLKKQEGLPKRLMVKKDLDIYINKVYSFNKQLNKYYNEVKSIKSDNVNEMQYLENQVNLLEKRINVTSSQEVNILTTQELEKKQITIKEKEELMKK